MIRVFIADHHPMMLLGIRQALSDAEEIEVTGEARNCVEVMTSEHLAESDILLLDLEFPRKCGWEVLRRTTSHYPKLRILIMSVSKEALTVMQALKMGAAGYITKSCDPEICIKAIKKLHEGGTYISEDIASEVAKMMITAPTSEGELFNLLTEREYQIFLLLVAGWRSTDIARELNISVKTVSTHRKNIMDKLKLKSNVDLVQYAVKANLILWALVFVGVLP